MKGRMHQNNFNALRLVAAWLVLYGHSFVFMRLPEPLFLSSLIIGPLGLFIFFGVSGYLVSESWDRDPNLWRFLARRFLRIFPGLFVCVTLTVLVLGPIFTTLPLRDYFTHPHTFMYFDNLWLYTVHSLPGIFPDNRVAGAVNGSLWSLPVEFFLYIMVCVIGVLWNNRYVPLALAIGAAALQYFWVWRGAEALVIYRTDMRQAVSCAIFFWVGACFYRFGIRRFFSLTSVVFAMVALLCLEPWPRLSLMSMWVLVPFVALAFGFAYSPWLWRVTGKVDYSYGLYIYAFPVQQGVAHLWPIMPIGLYLLLCTAITLLFAALSWHLVEARALAFKPRGRAVQPASG